MQIPRRMLDRRAAVYAPRPDASYGGEYLPPVELDGVRFEARWETRAGGYVFQDGSRGLLFVDAANTSGAFEVPAGSLVWVDGIDGPMTVKRCNRFEGPGGRPHHWELEVG